MQLKVEKYAIERREQTVIAEVSLSLESDVHFYQHSRSFGRIFSSDE